MELREETEELTPKNCSFCSSPDEYLSPVYDLTLIKNQESFHFPQILSDVLPGRSFDGCSACPSCVDVVNKFFLFKEKFEEISQLKEDSSVEQFTDITEIETDAKDESQMIIKGEKDEVFSIEVLDREEAAMHFIESIEEVSEFHNEQPNLKNIESQCEPTKAEQSPKKKPYKKFGKTAEVLKRLAGSMSRSDKEKLSYLIASSKSGNNKFVCQMCSKVLNSQSAIRYHSVSRHMLGDKTNTTADKSKRWVSEKIKERKTLALGNKIDVSWTCQICYNKYNSSDALRYHLSQHVKNEDVQINPNNVM